MHFINRTQKVEYLEESPYGFTNDMVIWLDELSCTGEEETVEDCDHDGWGVNDCFSYEHVAVHCFGDPSGDFIKFVFLCNFISKNKRQKYSSQFIIEFRN